MHLGDHLVQLVPVEPEPLRNAPLHVAAVAAHPQHEPRTHDPLIAVAERGVGVRVVRQGEHVGVDPCHQKRSISTEISPTGSNPSRFRIGCDIGSL